MIIAVSSPDGKFSTEFSPRFGRCNFFIIIDTDTRVNGNQSPIPPRTPAEVLDRRQFSFSLHLAPKLLLQGGMGRLLLQP